MVKTVNQQAVTIARVVINANDCPSCGIIYGLTNDYENARQEDGKRWYCPNGHRQHFIGKTDKEKLAQARATITHLGDQKDAAQRSADDYKGHFTRVKKKVERAENGVCPHCNRSFADLRRHMESKHQAELTDASRNHSP